MCVTKLFTGDGRELKLERTTGSLADGSCLPQLPVDSGSSSLSTIFQKQATLAPCTTETDQEGEEALRSPAAACLERRWGFQLDVDPHASLVFPLIRLVMDPLMVVLNLASAYHLGSFEA